MLDNVLTSIKNNKPEVTNILERGLNFAKQSEIRKAVECFQEVLALDENIGSAWFFFGTYNALLNGPEAGLGALRRAIELDPAEVAFRINYANTLLELNDRSCIDQMQAAFIISPDKFVVLKNLGVCLLEFGEPLNALKYLLRAKAVSPEDREILWLISTVQLQLGFFVDGWQSFDSRRRINGFPVEKKIPLWTDQPLKGKTIIVREEQGFGDTMLCSRYIPILNSMGAKVILKCRKPLHKLFSTDDSFRVVDVTTTIHADYYIPVMSLPAQFNTDTRCIPQPLPFKVNPVSDEIFQALGLGTTRFKVGIVWSGSEKFPQNSKRSTTLKNFLKLTQVEGVQFYSLQKGPQEKELQQANLSPLIIDAAPYLNDFADTAAILKNLDLVIMTDSSVAHLAGSLSIPIWNLLNVRSYWLYLTERFDTPWYSRMRLFRQTSPGKWDTVFAEVTKELEKAVIEKSAGMWNQPQKM